MERPALSRTPARTPSNKTRPQGAKKCQPRFERSSSRRTKSAGNATFSPGEGAGHGRDREPLRRPLCGELDELIAIGEELGGFLGARCVQALGIEPGQAQSYGKAAISEAGELRPPPLSFTPSAPLVAVEKGAALLSSKNGGLGTATDVPPHKDAAYVRSHFDCHGSPCVADALRATGTWWSLPHLLGRRRCHVCPHGL